MEVLTFLSHHPLVLGSSTFGLVVGFVWVAVLVYKSMHRKIEQQEASCRKRSNALKDRVDETGLNYAVLRADFDNTTRNLCDRVDDLVKSNDILSSDIRDLSKTIGTGIQHINDKLDRKADKHG